MDRSQSIALLNRAVADELHAVHQYMYFHFHLDDLGYGPLAALFKRTAIEEMMHIELLAERILFLKGDVELVPSAQVARIVDPQKILEKGVQMEDESAAFYNQAATECAANRDSQSKQIFERLVADRSAVAEDHLALRAHLPDRRHPQPGRGHGARGNCSAHPAVAPPGQGFALTGAAARARAARAQGETPHSKTRCVAPYPIAPPRWHSSCGSGRPPRRC